MKALPILALAALSGIVLAQTAAPKKETFTLLIFETDAQLAARTDPAKAPAYWAGYAKVAQEMTEAGVLRGGNALHWGPRVKTVQPGGIKTGFAEPAKNPLGGYFVIEVAGMDEALKWAGRIPASGSGSVAVVPAFAAPNMESR